MKRFALLLLAALAAAVLIAGCSKQNTLAEINGDRITYKEFVQDLGATPAAQKALSAMFERRLVVDLAKKKGVPVTDEQVDRRLDFLKKSQDLEEQMKQQGLTMDDVKRQLKVQEASSNLAMQLEKGKVKDEDIDKAYDGNTWVYNGEEGVKAEAALFRDKTTADAAEAELKKGASLEKALGVADPMAKMMGGGQVQKLVVRKNDPRPQLAGLIKAAFATPVGKATAPVVLQGAQPGQQQFVILKITSKLPAYKIDEKTAKILVKEDLSLQKATAPDGGELKKMIDAAKKSAKIKIMEPSMKDAEKEFRNPEPAMTGMVPSR